MPLRIASEGRLEAPTPGVLKEVKIANELSKPTFQIIGYKDGSEDWRLPDAGRVYSWSWDNLKRLLG